MNKTEFEKIVKEWINKFVNSNTELTLETIFDSENISKISHPILDKMPKSKLCDFYCDFVVLVKHKTEGDQLIFINRFTKSIGIRDIGEMLVYAKIAKPLYAFLISVNGHSNEINNILVNKNISQPLFQYDSEKNIILFALSEDGVQKDSVLPVHMRDYFYERI